MEELSAWQKWRMCGRKKSYETLSKANKAGKKTNQHSYQSPLCFTWHLTKQKDPHDEQAG